MSRFWLVGLVAVGVLVLGPTLMSMAADGEKPAKADGGKRGMARPEVVVDAAKMPELAKAIKAVEEAIAALQTQAAKDLPPDQVRALMMQTIGKTMRAANPDAKGGPGGRKMEGGGKRHAAPDAPAPAGG